MGQDGLPDLLGWSGYTASSPGGRNQDDILWYRVRGDNITGRLKTSKKLLTLPIIMLILCIDYIYSSGEFMHIQLSYSNPVPLYRQIVDQIKEKILSGELPPGTPLPSIRQLAEEAMTSVITTKRAYSELENEGIIVTRPGLGSFVANFTYSDLGAIREDSVNECISQLISTAKLVGISNERLLDMVKKALKEETVRHEPQ